MKMFKTTAGLLFLQWRPRLVSSTITARHRRIRDLRRCSMAWAICIIPSLLRGLGQRYFDQGLTLVYAFNHDEAARSFAYAAKLDPKCAMAYWGIALARGPNYNEWEIDPGREKTAAEAIKKAQSLSSDASAAEQAYIHAMAKRVSADPKADQKKMGASLPRRDARRDEALSERPGCRGAVRRRRHGSARLECSGSGTAQPEEGTTGGHPSAGSGAETRSGQHRRQSLLHSRDGGCRRIPNRPWPAPNGWRTWLRARDTWSTCPRTSTFAPAIITLRRYRTSRPWARTKGTSRSITSKICTR